ANEGRKRFMMGSLGERIGRVDDGPAYAAARPPSTDRWRSAVFCGTTGGQPDLLHERPTLIRLRTATFLLLLPAVLSLHRPAPPAPVLLLPPAVLVLAQQGRPRAAADDKAGVLHLFNGKDLTNFYTYLKGHGKGNDPEKVFTVHDGMIHVSGKVFGGLTTEKEYGNYHLVTEFKWGEKTWAPREKAARDSGILLHCVG